MLDHPFYQPGGENKPNFFLLQRWLGGVTDNQKIDLGGQFRLAGDKATYTVKLWSKEPGNVRLSDLRARGIVDYGRPPTTPTPPSNPEAIAPPNVNLTVGQAVFWKDPEATAENRRPSFHGYARIANGYVRLFGEEKPQGTDSVIVGRAEPYRPRTIAEDTPPRGLTAS